MENVDFLAMYIYSTSRERKRLFAFCFIYHMDETEFREVSVQEGYAIWADSYDQEHNGLIWIEERADMP